MTTKKMIIKKNNILECLKRNWPYIIILIGFFSAGLFFGRQECNVCWVQSEQLKMDTAYLRNCIRLDCKCDQSIELDPLVYNLDGNPFKNREVSGKIVVKGHASNVDQYHIYLVLKSDCTKLSYIKNIGFNVNGDFSEICFLGEGADTTYNGIKSYIISAIALDTSYDENNLYNEKLTKHIKVKSNEIPKIKRTR